MDLISLKSGEIYYIIVCETDKQFDKKEGLQSKIRSMTKNTIIDG